MIKSLLYILLSPLCLFIVEQGEYQPTRWLLASVLLGRGSERLEVSTLYPTAYVVMLPCSMVWLLFVLTEEFLSTCLNFSVALSSWIICRPGSVSSTTRGLSMIPGALDFVTEDPVVSVDMGFDCIGVNEVLFFQSLRFLLFISPLL